MAEKARKRKEIFKVEELHILLEEVEANKGLLFDRFKGAHTNKEKVKKWGEIAERITAVTGTTRSDVEVRKKWQDFVSLTKKKASELRHQTTKTGAGVNTAQALNDEEDRAMAIIGFSASQGIPGGVDIHAGLTEEGEPSSAQWKGDEEPRILYQSTSTATASTASATTSTVTAPPDTASTATASTVTAFNSCKCSQDLVQLEREKVGLLKDVVGLLREAGERDSKFQQEALVLKRAKLELASHQLALEEKKCGQQELGDAYYSHIHYIFRYLIWMLGKLNEL